MTVNTLFFPGLIGNQEYFNLNYFIQIHELSYLTNLSESTYLEIKSTADILMKLALMSSLARALPIMVLPVPGAYISLSIINQNVQ